MKVGDARAPHVSLLGLLALGALAGCGTNIEIPTLAEHEIWVIDITDPRGDWSECFSDDSIEHALTTADMPASSSTAEFQPEAEEDDVQRVLACLDGSLTSGGVAVRSVEAR